VSEDGADVAGAADGGSVGAGPGAFVGGDGEVGSTDGDGAADVGAPERQADADQISATTRSPTRRTPFT